MEALSSLDERIKTILDELQARIRCSEVVSAVTYQIACRFKTAQLTDV